MGSSGGGNGLIGDAFNETREYSSLFRWRVAPAPQSYILAVVFGPFGETVFRFRFSSTFHGLWHPSGRERFCCPYYTGLVRHFRPPSSRLFHRRLFFVQIAASSDPCVHPDLHSSSHLVASTKAPVQSFAHLAVSYAIRLR